MQGFSMPVEPVDIQETIAKFNQEYPVANKQVSMPVQATLYHPLQIPERIQKYDAQVLARENALRNSFCFINPLFHPEFRVRGGLYLICAESGIGKSSASANILSNFLKERDKQVVLITTEEQLEDIYNRVACIQTGIHFGRYRMGSDIARGVREKIRNQVLKIAERVEVADSTDTYSTTFVEDALAALLYGAQADAGLILIDYYQTINQCRTSDKNNIWSVKLFGDCLKEFCKHFPHIPVMLVAQISTKGSQGHPKFFKDRLEMDRSIYNHSSVVIEIDGDKSTLDTKFIFHKDRFSGMAGSTVNMKYNKAGFYEITDF